MSRIELTDTAMDVMVKMSDGNPGAIAAMMQILEKHDEIDPQAMLGGLGAIMILDTWEIYGSDIYVLFNDKCERDVRRMLLIMRAVQLGMFPESRLREIAADQSRRINLSEDEWQNIDKKVCDELKYFAKSA